MNLPGMSTFLHGDSGKQLIETASKNSTCIITLDQLEPPEWTNALKEKVGFVLFNYKLMSLDQ